MFRNHTYKTITQEETNNNITALRMCLHRLIVPPVADHFQETQTVFLITEVFYALQRVLDWCQDLPESFVSLPLEH